MKLSLRLQYIILFSTIHLSLIILTFIWLEKDRILFIVAEVFIILLIIATVKVYLNFMKPAQYLKTGIEVLKDQDFTIKFIPTGKKEIDTIVDVYNLMIDQLRLERTKLTEQHFFLEKLIEASPIAVLILAHDERISSVNTKA